MQPQSKTVFLGLSENKIGPHEDSDTSSLVMGTLLGPSNYLGSQVTNQVF